MRATITGSAPHTRPRAAKPEAEANAFVCTGYRMSRPVAPASPSYTLGINGIRGFRCPGRGAMWSCSLSCETPGRERARAFRVRPPGQARAQARVRLPLRPARAQATPRDIRDGGRRPPPQRALPEAQGPPRGDRNRGAPNRACRHGAHQAAVEWTTSTAGRRVPDRSLWTFDTLDRIRPRRASGLHHSPENAAPARERPLPSQRAKESFSRTG